MNIPASNLKALVKKLSAVKAEQVVFGKSRFIASESDLTVVVQNGFSEDMSGFAVNLRKFSSVVGRLSGEVSLLFTGGGLSLTSAKTKIVLETQDGKRPLFTVSGGKTVLPLGELAPLLRYASACSEPDRAHIYGGVVQISTKLSGIDVEQVIGFTVAGASEQRVAVADHEPENKNILWKDPSNILIPLTALPAILALDCDGAAFSETDKQLYFQFDDTEIYVAKLAKKYPNCSSVIPKEFTYVFEVSAEEFKSVLRTVEPIIDARDNTGCGVNVHFLDSSVVVKSMGSGDSAEDSLTATQVTPDPIFESADFSVNLNHRFLSDFFGAVSGTVTFSSNGPQKPVLLEAGNKKTLIAAMKEKK